MPFLNLNNNWSKLSQYYNQPFNNKPEVPRIKYTAFDDGLIRGGVLNVGISSVKDTARIGKFLLSGRGASFLIKQVGLQKSNPPLEQLSSFRSLSNSNTRLYNLGVNTLAQVPINALGGHIIRHGILPVGGVGFLNGPSLSTVDNEFRSPIKGYNYESIVTQNNKTQGSNYYPLANNTPGAKFNTNRLLQYLAITNSDSVKPVVLRDYNGGAASVYGIGNTVISTTAVRTTITQQNNSKLVFNGFNPTLSTDIAEAKQANLTSDLESQLKDSPLTWNNTIAGYNIEKRVGVSHKKGSVDSINVIDITDGGTFYTNEKGNKLAADVLTNYKDNVEGYYGNDIIKFRMEFLNNDGTPGVNNTQVLAFRAYIDDFNDGMNAKWNSYRYTGRGEEFYVYEGFTRDISVSFTLFAHTEAEMKPLYRKLNYLMSTFTPDYSSANKMRGNIGYLTVGEYLLRQPGVFTDIKLSGFLDSHWEIGIGEDGNFNDQYETPKYIKVALSFKPIHTFLPRTAKYTNGKPDYNTPFITPDSKRYPYFAKKGTTENKYLG